MEDEWLRRVLNACHAALDHVRRRDLDVDRRTINDLEDLCSRLEQRLRRENPTT